jgi:hypothetical protein
MYMYGCMYACVCVWLTPQKVKCRVACIYRVNINIPLFTLTILLPVSCMQLHCRQLCVTQFSSWQLSHFHLYECVRVYIQYLLSSQLVLSLLFKSFLFRHYLCMIITSYKYALAQCSANNMHNHSCLQSV